MNTDIRFLQQLEDDLTEAAAHETAVLAGAPDDEISAHRSRRLPRRERHWGAIAAGLLAFLVLAGSIGFLSQRPSQQERATSGAFSEVGEAVGGAPRAQASTAPMPATDEGATTWQASSGNGARAGSLTAGGVNHDSAAGGAAEQPALNAGPSLPATQQQGDLSKIVRDGRIAIVVPDGDFESSLTNVSRIATSLGGFVLTSSTRDQNTGVFTLRIPAKKFDVAMERLRGIGEVKADDVTGQDVTAEFIDQTARLQILLDRRDLLQSLQNEATTSSEILRLAGLIEQTQLEIEKTQGQLRYLKNQVAEATIKVDLRERHAPDDTPEPTTDNPSLADAIRLGWEGFLRVIGAVIVGLGYLVPIALIGLAIWGVVTLVRRRRREAS
ncbi:MAG: DUF4349 domain-containing protein [Solirubrobacterales bacterium]